MSGGTGGMDIRLPMGLMFGIIGVILTVYGVMTHGSDMYKNIDNLNINLIWGICLMGFGGLMLFLTWLAAKKK